MSRNPRHIPGQRPNPLRDLVAEKQRAAEIARARARAEQLKSDLPSMITEQVGEHMQKLETKLLKDFQNLGQKAIEESTSVLNDTLNGRIETLEQISAMQSRTLVNLRDSSRIAEQKVSTVVESIEKTLSGAVPGFKLEPSAFAAPLLATPASPLFESPAAAELVRAASQEIEETSGKYGFCPKCTSTRIRRANRLGIWEEFLRLFFIAPFRCRACRHKFYRF
jgi:uncharacterized coiled-coil protein SlyX/ribosomal protein L37AE/L43A